MIPFIRSHNELMVITQPKGQHNKSPERKGYNIHTEDSGQRKRYIRSKHEKEINLPNTPKTKRRKWTTRKEVLSKIFDELDYKNQVKSTNELKLIQRHKNYDHNDVA